MWRWAGPTCDQDVTGDGTRGSPKDRALCAFFIIRGICNGAADGSNRGLCYAATDPNAQTGEGKPTWVDFNEAANLRRQANSCLAFRYGAFGEIRGWNILSRGGGGGACRN